MPGRPSKRVRKSSSLLKQRVASSGRSSDQAGEVRDVLDAEVLLGLPARGYGVGVVAGGWREPLDVVLLQVLFLTASYCSCGSGIERVSERWTSQPVAGVLPVEVDLVVFERLADLLVAAHARPVYDRGVRGREHLYGDLAQHLLLRECL